VLKMTDRERRPWAIGWASTLSSDGVPNLAPFSFFHRLSPQTAQWSATMQPGGTGST